MLKTTFYELLQIRNTASPAEIQIAYEQSLKDAKDKLADSPLYYNREKQLNDAYNTLIQTESRQIYDENLQHEQLLAEKRLHQQNNIRTQKTNKSHKKQRKQSDKSSPILFLGKLIFSKVFLGSIIAIIALIIFLPSSKDRVISDAITKQYELQNKQLELEQQKYQQQVSTQLAYREEAISSRKKRELENQKRRIRNEQQATTRQLEREQLRIDQAERRLTKQEEREKKQEEYKANREKQALQRKQEREAQQLARSRREQEYAAKQRLNKIQSKQQRETYINNRNKKVTSLELGY